MINVNWRKIVGDETVKTPLELVRMFTLLMDASNSIAHMQDAMNMILKEFISSKTRLFLDDTTIKECLYKEKDETDKPDGFRQFV